MKKKDILSTFFGLIFALNFLSAAQFSIGELLGGIDPSTMILGSLFLIFFMITNFVFSRTFRDQYGYPNTKLGGSLAFIISLLMTYGINLIGLDYDSLFGSMGISTDIFYTIAPIIFFIIAIFLLIRLRTLGVFILGILMLIISFTDLVYEKGTMLGIGIFLIILSAIFFWIFRRRGFHRP